MKKIKLIIIAIMFFAVSAKSQVTVNVNIGSPPLWGPVGYSEARYYYLPDVEAYYDVQSSMFIYYGGGVWLHRPYLPVLYRNYDLYSGYKVVMVDYHGNTPYTNFKMYKVKYAKGYRGKAQKTIGSKPGKGNSGGSPKKQSNSGNNNKAGSGNGKSSGNGQQMQKDNGKGSSKGKGKGK